MPPYEAFLSGENLVKFWDIVKWLLFLIAPGLLIWIAIEAVHHLITVVRKSVTDEANKDDDDDYDVYRY